MEAHDELPSATGSLALRRVPCIAAYLHPFRLVNADNSVPWVCNIEQVNNNSWDYVALHEMVGGVDVGLEPPYHLVIARDGAIALPPIPELRSVQSCVEFFNRCLAGLLLGGVYCEALTSDGLDKGSIIDWKYIRCYGDGKAWPNRFHNHIRHRKAGALESIDLYRPRTLRFQDVADAMSNGIAFLNRLPTVRGEYLLKGVTAIARRDWGAALANLWITIEQVLSHLWDENILNPTLLIDPSRSRKSQLTDTRTWTSSARIEMLFQKSIISNEIVQQLGTARKARNELLHKGLHPSESEARGALSGALELIVLALKGDRPALLDINLADHSLSDPFVRPERLIGEPEFWMEIPKLPGEADLERQETAERNRSRRDGHEHEPSSAPSQPEGD